MIVLGGGPCENIILSYVDFTLLFFINVSDELAEEVIRAGLRKLMGVFGVIELFDPVIKKVVDHKLFRFLVFVFVMSCTIPMAMFVLLGVTTVFLTFTGFIFITGGLLAMSGLFMCSCLVAMLFILMVLTLTSIALYVLAVIMRNFLIRFSVGSAKMKSIAPAVVQSKIQKD